MIKMPAMRWAVVLVAATTLACGGSGDGSPTGTGQPTPVLTSLTLSLAPTTLQVGQTATATVAGRDQFGASITTGNVTWSSSASAVATVSASGTVTAIGAGQATITAAAGSITAS